MRAERRSSASSQTTVPIWRKESTFSERRTAPPPVTISLVLYGLEPMFLFRARESFPRRGRKDRLDWHLQLLGNDFI